MYNEKVIMSEEKKVFLISMDLLNPKTLLLKVFLNISLFFLNCGLALLFRMHFLKMKTLLLSVFNPDWWYLLIATKTKGSVRSSRADILLHR